MNKQIFFLIAVIVLSLSCSTPKPPLNIVPISEGEKREDHESFGKNYMISSQGHFASKAGAKMFERGGNAIDAAVAISFVISVERPQSTGIGGGGFMLVYKNGMKAPMAVDFREKAPVDSYEKMYLHKDGSVIKKKSLDGIFAVGVPGLVAGVLDVHNKFGQLPLKMVMQPSIELAEKGFPVYPELEKAIKSRRHVLNMYTASRKIFLHKDGSPLKKGDYLVQKDLGKTLREIAQKGRSAFYNGTIADLIVKENNRLHGLLSKKDFTLYKVKYRNPVKGTFKGYDLYSMSPPSSGGVHIIQILNILEGDKLKKMGVLAPRTVHLTASAMQRAFADRASYLGDPDFVEVPVTGLTSKKYAQILRKKITANKVSHYKEVAKGDPFPYESPETTHFTIIDKEGTVVSSTQTINGYFGSGVVVPGTGIVLNNEMDDFAVKVGALNLFGAVGGNKNLVFPEKRPLSSMSPTIVFKDGKPILSLGSPSGTRIITCVALTLLNYLEHKLPLYESVATSRYHHQWRPDELRIEEMNFPKHVVTDLKEMGYVVRFKKSGCRIQAVSKEEDVLHGVSDPRGSGMSIGN